ncbi:uncharacterized protein BJX67DRAFT_358386 [Aspergillus lucknowensis]|uniref:Uncharacterized protein n=1 Tax=Aspergillus lucknowensis TaxID=176173 RepID=A0ABR4LLZ5_9EURO
MALSFVSPFPTVDVAKGQILVATCLANAGSYFFVLIVLVEYLTTYRGRNSESPKKTCMEVGERWILLSS